MIPGAVLFVCAVLALAWRASHLAPGLVTTRRRAAAVLALAGLTLVPLAPALLLPTTVARGLTMVVEPSGALVPDERAGVDAIVAGLAWWSVLAAALQFVLPPRRFRPSDLQHPVHDPLVLARIDAMAAALGLRRPRALQRRDERGGGPTIAAWAIDGLAPTIVVDEGVLLRLAPDERDALLAHEVGHLARRAAVRFVIFGAVAAVVAVLASAVLPLVAAVALLLALGVFVRVVVGQHEEFAADRLAGRLVGAHVVARALDRTHAANYQADTGPWVHAFVTHPHLAERAARLGVHADPSLVRRARRARRLGGTAALGALVASVWLGANGFAAAASALALAVALAPFALLLALQPWRTLRDARRLGLRMLRPHVRLRLSFLVGGLGCLVLAAAAPAAAGLALPAGVALLALTPFVGRRELRARQQLAAHQAAGDWPAWRAAYESLPARLRARPDLWLFASDVHWHLGDHDRADRELELLLARRPDFHLARFTQLARCRAAAPARAVQLARDLVVRLPGHPLAELALASALRYAGELDEAWTTVQSALRRRPREGVIHSVACRIACARRDFANAHEALAAGERLAPGDLRVVFAAAELAVAEGRPDAADRVRSVRARLAREPFHYLDADLAALEPQPFAPTPADAARAPDARG